MAFRIGRQETALLEAAADGEEEVVRALLEQEADVEPRLEGIRR
jgi:hypothetical protein